MRCLDGCNCDVGSPDGLAGFLVAICFLMLVMIVLLPLVPIYVYTFVYGWVLVIYSACKFRTVPVIRLPKGHKEDEQIE